VSWLLPLLPYLLALGGLVGGYLYADRACWSTACHKVTAERDALKTEKAAAIQRATDLALLYGQTLDKVDAAAKAARKEADARFADLSVRAKSAAGNRTVPVASASVRLWADASLSANGIKAPAAGLSEERAPVSEASVSEAELNQFVTDAAAAYRAVDDARLACIALYEGTQ
jgi:hypothetical protein